jgi:para-nitrobenzyl esterase
LANWPAYSIADDNELEFTSAGAPRLNKPSPVKAQIDLVEPLNEANQTVNRQYQ